MFCVTAYALCYILVYSVFMSGLVASDCKQSVATITVHVWFQDLACTAACLRLCYYITLSEGHTKGTSVSPKNTTLWKTPSENTAMDGKLCDHSKPTIQSLV